MRSLRPAVINACNLSSDSYSGSSDFAQLEEAYVRATVTLTRAQKLCIIMGPLDMRELLGAATVIECLKYSAGVCGVHVDNPSAEVFLKERSLNAGPDDSAFLQSLR